MRSVRIRQRRQSTRRCREINVTGYAARGTSTSTQPRSRVDRSCRRRSHYTDTGAEPAAQSESAFGCPRLPRLPPPVRRAIPGSPRIHVQSRRDSTRPPCLVAQQERTRPGGPVPSRMTFSTSGPPSRPPTPTAVRPAAAYCLKPLYSNQQPFFDATIPCALRKFSLATAARETKSISVPFTERVKSRSTRWRCGADPVREDAVPSGGARIRIHSRSAAGRSERTRQTRAARGSVWIWRPSLLGDGVGGLVINGDD
jgi:hypothetical protein